MYPVRTIGRDYTPEELRITHPPPPESELPDYGILEQIANGEYPAWFWPGVTVAGILLFYFLVIKK